MKRLAILAFMGCTLAAHAQKDVFVSWGSKDVHYEQYAQPHMARATTDTTLTAWRGERAAMQAVVYAPTACGKLKVRRMAGGEAYDCCQKWLGSVCELCDDG